MNAALLLRVLNQYDLEIGRGNFIAEARDGGLWQPDPPWRIEVAIRGVPARLVGDWLDLKASFSCQLPPSKEAEAGLRSLALPGEGILLNWKKGVPIAIFNNPQKG